MWPRGIDKAEHCPLVSSPRTAAALEPSQAIKMQDLSLRWLDILPVKLKPTLSATVTPYFVQLAFLSYCLT
jgi:hypothetical protein